MKEMTKTNDIFTMSEQIAAVVRQLSLEDAQRLYVYASALQDRSVAERIRREE